MIEYLKQMMELSDAIDLACDASDVDRVVALLKRRKELADRMEMPNPEDPSVQSGEVADLLGIIVERDGIIEDKIRKLMQSLQNAIKTVQGEKKVVRGYLKQTGSDDPRYLDKEG